MQITVVGTGFVGVVTAGVFAKFGNTVYALDVDREKIQLLKKGQIPFFEPNLKELVDETTASARLIFTTDYREAVSDSEVIFICVGTPSAPDGGADLKYVFSAAESLAPYLREKAIVIVKSTVPPTTDRKIREIIKAKTGKQFFTASVPEFLKEGSAVNDAFNPERVVVGARERYVVEKLLDLHKPFAAEKIIVSPQSAMLVKYAANAYLATRIAFINEIANLCEKVGADIEEVIKGLGADKRIGSHYWYPGPGYGGSCFPKDVKELSALAHNLGERDGLFAKINNLNENRIPRLIKQYEKQVGGFLNKKIAVLGLSFKPNTDDLREAPSLKIIPLLLGKGAMVIGFDPKAGEAARKIFKNSISYAPSVYKAVMGADIAIVLVEWDEFKQLNLAKIKNAMKGNIFIDTRNIYDPKKFKSFGLKYIGIGR